MSEQEIVVACEGGGMRGVFGAGVVDILAKANIHSKLRAVTGASAGTLNAAALLTHQTDKALNLYERFATSGSVNREHLPHVLLSQIRRLLFGTPRRGTRCVVDIEGILDCVQDAGLHMEAIRQQHIPFLVRCLSLRTRQQVFVDMHTHTDPWGAIADSLAAVPYCTPSPRQDDHVDPMIQDPLSITPLLERFPEEKIVSVLNSPARHYDSLRGVLTQMIHGGLSMDWKILRHYVGKRRRGRMEMERAKRSGRVMFIAPPDDYPMTNSTTNTGKIRRGFAMGQKAGEAALRLMGM